MTGKRTKMKIRASQPISSGHDVIGRSEQRWYTSFSASQPALATYRGKFNKVGLRKCQVALRVSLSPRCLRYTKSLSQPLAVQHGAEDGRERGRARASLSPGSRKRRP